VEEIPILSGDDPSHAVKLFIAQYDAPAYIRRARQVEEALTQLVERCRQQRDQWLKMARLRLGFLKARAGDWNALLPWLADEDQLETLRQLDLALSPQLRVPIAPTRSARILKRLLRELHESLERFDTRWQRYLASIDLTQVNRLIDGYNRYYLLEKECVFRSARLARQGFRPLEPMTVERLQRLLPRLPALLLRDL
jgi:hypothetical protein